MTRHLSADRGEGQPADGWVESAARLRELSERATLGLYRAKSSKSRSGAKVSHKTHWVAICPIISCVPEKGDTQTGSGSAAAHIIAETSRRVRSVNSVRAARTALARVGETGE